MHSLSQDIIDYYKENHQLFNYHIDAIQFFLSKANFEGKKVLEIGGSNLPRELVINELKCKKWVSVDVIGEIHYAMEQQSAHYKNERIYSLAKAADNIESDNYILFDGFAENIPSVFYNDFDIVISITAFEHVIKMEQVLDKIYSSLKPNGHFLSYHGPIWSCYCGHHIWVTPELNFNNLGPMPPFIHLLMDPAEAKEFLKSHVTNELADQAIEQMFFSDRVNRLFYEDYESQMAMSKFKSYECEPYGFSETDQATLIKLKERHPSNGHFEAYGMLISARKQ